MITEARISNSAEVNALIGAVNSYSPASNFGIPDEYLPDIRTTINNALAMGKHAIAQWTTIQHFGISLDELQRRVKEQTRAASNLLQRAPERRNLSTYLLLQSPLPDHASNVAISTALSDAKIQQLPPSFSKILEGTSSDKTTTPQSRGTTSNRPKKRTLRDRPQPTYNRNGNQSEHNVSATDIFRRDLEATISAYESGRLRSILPPTYIPFMPHARQLLRTLVAFPDVQVDYSQAATTEEQILNIFDIVRDYEFPSYPRASSVTASSEGRRDLRLNSEAPVQTTTSNRDTKRQSPIPDILRDEPYETLNIFKLPPSPRHIKIDGSAIPQRLQGMYADLLESRTIEPRTIEKFMAEMTLPQEGVRFSSPLNSMDDTQWIGVEYLDHNRRAMLSAPRAQSHKDLENGYIDVDDQTHRIRIKLNNGEVEFIRFGAKEARRIDELQTYQPTQEKAEHLYHLLDSIYREMVHQSPHFRGSQAMDNVGRQLDYVLSAFEGEPKISQVRQPVTQYV